VSDYENGSQFTIGKRVRPVLSPQVSAPDPATKATGIVATRLSCPLENGSPGDAAKLGQNMAFFHLEARLAQAHDNPSEFCDAEQPTLRPLVAQLQHDLVLRKLNLPIILITGQVRIDRGEHVFDAVLDGKQTPGSSLANFFDAIYNECASARPKR
jgi:hypothetical protein